MAVQLPPCPVSLKPIQHYLKTATEHDGRDPVISYWCRIYALQNALKIDKKSDEAKIMLMGLMDWLEKEKKRLSDNEAITNDIAAQAHIENYALKLFLWADGQDRASIFNKNVVKAFYTAGFLMDVLSEFGELTEEIQHNCKYAKWKAAYIHNCLKNGEMPVPGPAADSPAQGSSDLSIGFEDLNKAEPKPAPGPQDPSSSSTYNYPMPPSTYNYPTPPAASGPSPTPSSITMTYNPPTPYSGTTSSNSSIIVPHNPPPTPVTPDLSHYNQTSSNGIKLQPDQITKAQKYCKFAGSALNYDDVPEAIANLQKALLLLTTGQDS